MGKTAAAAKKPCSPPVRVDSEKVGLKSKRAPTNCFKDGEAVREPFNLHYVFAKLVGIVAKWCKLN